MTIWAYSMTTEVYFMTQKVCFIGFVLRFGVYLLLVILKPTDSFSDWGAIHWFLLNV